MFSDRDRMICYVFLERLYKVCELQGFDGFIVHAVSSVVCVDMLDILLSE